MRDVSRAYLDEPEHRVDVIVAGGIAGGAPSSSPEFSCFIPGEGARVAFACASVPTSVAIERERV
jgi:hypothetical protein